MARWDSHSIQITFIIIYVLKVLVYHQVYIYHIISELPARKPFLTLYHTFYWAKHITIYYKKKNNSRDSHLFKFIIGKIFEGRYFINGHDLTVSLIITN